jgi:hypothetical protein
MKILVNKDLDGIKSKTWQNLDRSEMYTWQIMIYQIRHKLRQQMENLLWDQIYVQISFHTKEQLYGKIKRRSFK